MKGERERREGGREEGRGMEFLLFEARIIGKQLTFEEHSHGEICLNFKVLLLEIKDFTILYCILPF